MNPPYFTKYRDGRTVLVCRSGNRVAIKREAGILLLGKWRRSPNDDDFADTDILDSPKGDKKGKHG